MIAGSVSFMRPRDRGLGFANRDQDAEPVRLFLENRDPTLFSELVRKYERPVFRLSASVLGPGFESAAEDLTQEIFVHVFHKLGTFRFASRFSTWLYRVAYRKAIDEKRKARYSRPHVGESALEQLEDPAADPLTRSVQDERDAHLRECVAGLGEPQRTSVLLFYWMESPVEEIAKLLDSKPATVRSHLHRARAKLRKMIDDDAGTEALT